MFQTILFPIDPSQESQHAAELVIDLARTYSSRLVLTFATAPDIPEEKQEGIAPFLDRVQLMFTNQGIETTLEPREGQPAFVICDVADDLKVDLIVMGCRGLGLTEEGLADSVTNRVINLAPCPVLVVP